MEITSEWKAAWKHQIKNTRSEALQMMAHLQQEFSKSEILTILSFEYGNEYLPLLRQWWDNLMTVNDDSQEARDTRKQLKQLFNSMYANKAQEITGKSSRPDGKPIHPRWTAKENALLKQDHEHYGEHTLRQLFVLFFRDAVTQVANFTRYKNAAGYTYPVFHGSIAKLEMSGQNAESCPHCGEIRGHKDSCPIIQEMRRRDEEWKEQVRQEQENYEGPDITELFKEKLKKPKEKQ